MKVRVLCFVLLAAWPAAAGYGFAQTHRLTLTFEESCVDLDTGVVTGGGCPLHGEASTLWDVQAAYHSRRAVHAVIAQNPLSGAAIAHLQATRFEDVTPESAADAAFSEEIVDAPFDASRVILIRTDRGAVFKLGNPSEDESGIGFDAALLVPAP